MSELTKAEKLLELLILMEVPQKERIEIAAAMDTTEILVSFLDKLSEKNYKMTPEEVYEASIETALEFQTA